MQKQKSDIFKLIYSAIKDADRGLFFVADYNKQAYNVIKTLETSGFKIVPKNPSDTMLLAGKEQINYGLTSSKELVRQIYENMINAV